jgi:hypothetical protein
MKDDIAILCRCGRPIAEHMQHALAIEARHGVTEETKRRARAAERKATHQPREIQWID